jgi:predicted lipoprotein with Yx(FWY)xxD motif
MSVSTFAVRLLGVTATLMLAAACSNISVSPVSGNTGGTLTSGMSASTSTSGGVLGVATTSLGPVLVDRKGFTMYLLTVDTPGYSTCSAQCLNFWPFVSCPVSGSSSGSASRQPQLSSPSV